jgi:rubrerythrin
VGLFDRWIWKCSVCGASTTRRHHHCRVCTAVRDDMLPFPSPKDLDETAG